MVRALLIRGMLAGILAGLLAFGCAKGFGEPQINRAIAFEDQMHLVQGEAPEPELVSRAVQRSIGLFTAVVVYGCAFGGLFALVFAYAYGRIGNLSPRATAALLAAAAFLTLVVVPDIKYPANPPAIGHPDTIGLRTSLFLAMIVASIAALLIAARVGRRLVARMGSWNAVLVGGATFIVLVACVEILLPSINEVPDGFPAAVLWRFRVTSLGVEAILWTTIGLAFGALAENALARGGRWTPALRKSIRQRA